MTGFSPPIAVLLATYQGARYLQAQLDSLAGQSHDDWRLIASDDGSTDGTRDILRRFAADHPNREITLVNGPRRGATQNFLHLISYLRDGEALAYCDQDDVWLPDRLALGAAAMAAEEAGGEPGDPGGAADKSISARLGAEACDVRGPTGAAPVHANDTEYGIGSRPSPAGDQGCRPRQLSRDGSRTRGGGDPSIGKGDRMTVAGMLGSGMRGVGLWGDQMPGATAGADRMTGSGTAVHRACLASPAGRDLGDDDDDHRAGSAKRAAGAPAPDPKPASSLRPPAAMQPQHPAPQSTFKPAAAPAGRPILHVTRTIICDEALNELREAPLYRRPAGFLNALVQACTPGNTTLVNPSGAALLKAAAPSAARAGIVSHDWWSYQLIAGAGGVVLRDPRQTVFYRQHRGNVMGRNDTPRAMLARLARLGAGDYGDWLRANIAALDGAAPLLTAANRERLAQFAAAIEAPGPLAAARLARLGVYRQTRGGTLALLAAAAAGRLAQRGTA